MLVQLHVVTLPIQDFLSISPAHLHQCPFLMYNVQDYSVRYKTLLVRSYVRVDILLTCGEHLHDRIISLTREAWTHRPV